MNTFYLKMIFNLKKDKFLILVPLSMIGIFFALMQASIWTVIPLEIDLNNLGMGFGIVIALQNLMIFICPLIYGVITEKTINIRFGYYYSEFFVIALIFIAILISIFLNIYDKKTNNVLN